MTVFKVVSSVILVSLLAGCATFKRTENLSSSLYKSPAEASLAVKPIGKAIYGDFVNFNINEDLSPSLSRPDGGKNYFEVIEVDGKKDQPFDFVVASICDCLGFSKTTVLPEALLFGQTGTLIAKAVRVPNPVAKEMKGTFPYTGAYRMLVIADAAHEGEKISEAEGYLPGAIPFGIPMTISVDGKVQVNWLKKQP